MQNYELNFKYKHVFAKCDVNLPQKRNVLFIAYISALIHVQCLYRSYINEVVN